MHGSHFDEETTGRGMHEMNVHRPSTDEINASAAAAARLRAADNDRAMRDGDAGTSASCRDAAFGS